MGTALLILGFIALAGLFAHGGASSMNNPRPTEREIEQETLDGLYCVGKAILAGIVLFLVGLSVIALF